MVKDFAKIEKENKKLKKELSGKKSAGWKPMNKAIIKKEPRATYVVESAPDYRSSSFRKAWSKESILKWT